MPKSSGATTTAPSVVDSSDSRRPSKTTRRPKRHFSPSELRNIRELYARIKPQNNEDWKKIAEIHNATTAHNRTWRSIYERILRERPSSYVNDRRRKKVLQQFIESIEKEMRAIATSLDITQSYVDHIRVHMLTEPSGGIKITRSKKTVTDSQNNNNTTHSQKIDTTMLNRHRTKPCITPTIPTSTSD